MRLFTGLFNMVVKLPIAVVQDVVLEPIKFTDALDDSKSETRRVCEEIDDNLGE